MTPLGTAFSAINSTHITDLANQVAAYNARGIDVFIRLAPEMNGNWYPWALRPIDFIQLWINVTNAVRAVAPRTAMVFAPQALPDGAFPVDASVTGDIDPANLEALDTNKNGVYDTDDNPYTPWWPGAQYVDWIGTSLYYFGPQCLKCPGNPYYGVNQVPPTTYFANTLLGGTYPFYDWVQSTNKPLSISEWGVAHYNAFTPNGTNGTYLPITAGAAELPQKRGWWLEGVANTATYVKFPLIKMFGLFEFRKVESGTARDFQLLNISNTNNITQNFMADLNSSGVAYQWAIYTPPPPPAANSTSPATVPQTGSALKPLSTAGGVITALMTGLLFTFP
ncbi:hypothetical protein SmJEL517_g01431 [Synchytrium microbalum]|uniref:GH26 domain-containing protein n=1 Tax=Synchytrium microbalum TaxID=1806994 RepID=A0A507CE21_9FUNG|nr:uncharacterized protein SmJEL517_g01431 [Synchytrium microbalum]TPX36174.1 hypothetical protein SmJEL517_g01431 [Synchytrium microbalum]